MNRFFDVSGDFSGARIGGAPNASYRFTGIYTENTGTDSGLFSFDLDDNKNTIDGFAYSIEEGVELKLIIAAGGCSIPKPVLIAQIPNCAIGS